MLPHPHDSFESPRNKLFNGNEHPIRKNFWFFRHRIRHLHGHVFHYFHFKHIRSPAHSMSSTAHLPQTWGRDRTPSSTSTFSFSLFHSLFYSLSFLFLLLVSLFLLLSSFRCFLSSFFLLLCCILATFLFLLSLFFCLLSFPSFFPTHSSFFSGQYSSTLPKLACTSRCTKNECMYHPKTNAPTVCSKNECTHNMFLYSPTTTFDTWGARPHHETVIGLFP